MNAQLPFKTPLNKICFKANEIHCSMGGNFHTFRFLLNKDNEQRKNHLFYGWCEQNIPTTEKSSK